MAKRKTKTQAPTTATKPATARHQPWHEDCQAHAMGHHACKCPKCEEHRRCP